MQVTRYNKLVFHCKTGCRKQNDGVDTQPQILPLPCPRCSKSEGGLILHDCVHPIFMFSCSLQLIPNTAQHSGATASTCCLFLSLVLICFHALHVTLKQLR